MQAGNWTRGPSCITAADRQHIVLVKQVLCCTLFTSKSVNRSQGGESEVDWCLASLDSVSFTRSLSIVVTSYKRHFCTPDCTGAPVGLYIEAQWVEHNTNNSHRAYTGVCSMYLHSDKIQK